MAQNMKNVVVEFFDGTSGVGKTTLIETIHTKHHKAKGCLLDYMEICKKYPIFVNKSNEPITDLFYQTHLIGLVFQEIASGLGTYDRFVFDRAPWSNAIYNIIGSKFSDYNYTRIADLILLQNQQLLESLTKSFPEYNFTIENIITIDSLEEQLASRLKKRMETSIVGLEKTLESDKDTINYIKAQNEQFLNLTQCILTRKSLDEQFNKIKFHAINVFGKYLSDCYTQNFCNDSFPNNNGFKSNNIMNTLADYSDDDIVEDTLNARS